MTIDDDLGAADPAAIDDAGMVQLITEYKVTFFPRAIPPEMRRDPVEDVPPFIKASAAACSTFGWWVKPR